MSPKISSDMDIEECRRLLAKSEKQICQKPKQGDLATNEKCYLCGCPMLCKAPKYDMIVCSEYPNNCKNKRPFCTAEHAHIPTPRNNNISISNGFNISDGVDLEGQKGRKTFRHQPIRVKIATSPDDLFRLMNFLQNNEEEFYKQLLYNFLLPGVEKLRKGGRGKHKATEREPRISWIKTEAGCLYLFFSYWCKKPFKEWPESLSNFIKNIDKADKDYIVNLKGKYGAIELSSYCLSKYCGDTLNKYEIYPFNEITNFYLTYVHPRLKHCKALLKKTDKKEITSFNNTPIRDILKFHKIV